MSVLSLCVERLSCCRVDYLLYGQLRFRPIKLNFQEPDLYASAP